MPPRAATAGPLQRLAPGQAEAAAALAAAAFVDTPCYTYIYEGLDAPQRLAALTWLFGTNIRLRGAGARCAFSEDDPEMLCFFMLQPPDSPEIGTLAMLRNGMLAFPCRFGWRPLLRLLRVKRYHELAERRARQQCGAGARFSSLERMVVAPSAQGSGIGSRCLGAALAEAAEAGHTVVLSTQSQRNVRFYTRLGFEELERDEDYFKTGESKGETNWVMVKRPPTPAQSPGRGGSASMAVPWAPALLVCAAAVALVSRQPPPPPATCCLLTSLLLPFLAENYTPPGWRVRRFTSEHLSFCGSALLRKP